VLLRKGGSVTIAEEEEERSTTAPERAQAILDTMESMANDAGHAHVRPNVQTYYLCLKAWVRSQGGDVALERMEDILGRLEAMVDATTAGALTSSSHSGDVSGDGGNVGREEGVVVVEEEEERAGTVPSYVRCYNLYLYALSNNHHSNQNTPAEMVKKATDVLTMLQHRSAHQHQHQQQQEQEHPEMMEVEDPRSWKPDTDTYHQVIACYSKMRNEEGARNAQAIFDQMIHPSNTTTTSSNNSNSGDPEEDGTTTYDIIQPDASTCNELMSCWLKITPTHNLQQHDQQRQRRDDTIKRRLAIQKIEAIITYMNDSRKKNSNGVGAVYASCCSAPNIVSVNTLIAAIARGGRKDAMRRVQYVLGHMEEEYGVEPDKISYNLVMDAHAKSRDIRAFLKVERLLTTMEESYLDGYDNLQPDIFSYTTTIDAIPPNRSDAGRKAQSILARMEDMYIHHGGDRPSTAVYNAVMNAWVKRGGKNGINRIREILQRMEEQSGDDDDGEVAPASPNTVSYNTLLKAYSRGQAADVNYIKESEELLTRMERIYNLTNNTNARVVPDVVTYSTIITTYARSNKPNKAKHAITLLQKMIKSYDAGNTNAKPSIYTFNACLNACAYTTHPNEKNNAFLIAITILLSLEKYTKPDHVTYGTLLRAFSNLLSEDVDRRNHVVTNVFTQCRKEGMVGSLVIQQMKFAASPDVFRELVGRDILEDGIGTSSLPAKWSRNVRERQAK